MIDIFARYFTISAYKNKLNIDFNSFLQALLTLKQYIKIEKKYQNTDE